MSVKATHGVFLRHPESSRAAVSHGMIDDF
jgi:hypothetical protein